MKLVTIFCLVVYFSSFADENIKPVTHFPLEWIVNFERSDVCYVTIWSDTGLQNKSSLVEKLYLSLKGEFPKKLPDENNPLNCKDQELTLVFCYSQRGPKPVTEGIAIRITRLEKNSLNAFVEYVRLFCLKKHKGVLQGGVQFDP